MRRYAVLQELIPQKEKVDKATILTQVVDYIRSIQVLGSRLHASKGHVDPC